MSRARKLVDWNVPFQRCVFHKPRHVWTALVVPEDLSAKEGRAYKRRLIRQAVRMWQAGRLTTARQLHTDWWLRWVPEQPAVAIMWRDVDQTLTFYRVQATAKQQWRAWPATQLRTTSRLEWLFWGCGGMCAGRRGSQDSVSGGQIGRAAWKSLWRPPSLFPYKKTHYLSSVSGHHCQIGDNTSWP